MGGKRVWARRNSGETLLEGAAREEGPGFAAPDVLPYPGSPRLGSADPGLKYAAPLGLVSSGAVGVKNEQTCFQLLMVS